MENQLQKAQLEGQKTRKIKKRELQIKNSINKFNYVTTSSSSMK